MNRSENSLAAVSTLYADLVTATRATGWADQAEADESQWLRGQWNAQVLVYCLLHERILAAGATQGDEAKARGLAQSVFDLMTYDWDQTLRVRGAGDAKTIRLMRHLGQGFYGRMRHYQEAIAQEDEALCLQSLEEMIARTLLADKEDAGADTETATKIATKIAREVLALREALNKRDSAEVWAGVCLTSALKTLQEPAQEEVKQEETK